jgi:hypothetical protein
MSPWFAHRQPLRKRQKPLRLIMTRAWRRLFLYRPLYLLPHCLGTLLRQPIRRITTRDTLREPIPPHLYMILANGQSIPQWITPLTINPTNAVVG